MVWRNLYAARSAAALKVRRFRATGWGAHWTASFSAVDSEDFKLSVCDRTNKAGMRIYQKVHIGLPDAPIIELIRQGYVEGFLERGPFRSAIRLR